MIIPPSPPYLKHRASQTPFFVPAVYSRDRESYPLNIPDRHMAYEAIHDRCRQALPYTLTTGNKQALITMTRKRMVRGTLAMNPDGGGD